MASNPYPQLSPLLVGEVLERMSVLPGTVEDYEDELVKVARGLRCTPDVIQVLRLRFAAVAQLIADQAVARKLLVYRLGPGQKRWALTVALAIMVAEARLDGRPHPEGFSEALDQLIHQFSASNTHR